MNMHTMALDFYSSYIKQNILFVDIKFNAIWYGYKNLTQLIAACDICTYLLYAEFVINC